MERLVEAAKRCAVRPERDQASSQLFDKLRFSIIPRLNYWLDGRPGKRTLFISNEEETATVNLEEDMRCLDLVNLDANHCVEFRQGMRYLHQSRAAAGKGGCRNCAFFHMEIPDSAGNVHCLPGQMVASGNYVWTSGVEPILIDILNSITIADTEITDRV